MPNQDGINDHNGENAETLAAGYKIINRKSIFSEIFEFIDKATASGKKLRVLDIGSGAGNDAIEIAKFGHYVVGIEPSDLRHVAIRDHSHPNIQYRDGLLPKLGTVNEDEKFDLVIMSAVWQYIDPAERVESLARIADILNPDGKLVLSYPSPPSRIHQYEVSPEMLKADIEAANALLPKSNKLSISGEPVVIPDSRGRKSLDGRELNFFRYTIEAN
jgi:SAM-dependent methyltransferase